MWNIALICKEAQKTKTIFSETILKHLKRHHAHVLILPFIRKVTLLYHHSYPCPLLLCLAQYLEFSIYPASLVILYSNSQTNFLSSLPYFLPQEADLHALHHPSSTIWHRNPMLARNDKPLSMVVLTHCLGGAWAAHGLSLKADTGPEGTDSGSCAPQVWLWVGIWMAAPW